MHTRDTPTPDLRCGGLHDHIAQICDLLHDDIDDFLWWRDSPKEGLSLNALLQELENRVHTKNDLRAAQLLYAAATETAVPVLDLYLRHRELFDQIAPRRNLLPSLFSIHPGTQEIARQMRTDSRLGAQTELALPVALPGLLRKRLPREYLRAGHHPVRQDEPGP